MELAYDTCPHCVEGMTLSDHRAEMVPCQRCYGRGAVITNHRCACGRPCNMVSTDKHLYCGEKTCLTDLRISAREDSWESVDLRKTTTTPRQFYDHINHKWTDHDPSVGPSGYGFGWGHLD